MTRVAQNLPDPTRDMPRVELSGNTTPGDGPKNGGSVTVTAVTGHSGDGSADMIAAREVLEALSSMGITIEARNGGLRYRPSSLMTPDILAAVRDSKPALLELLAGPDSHADREWERFLAVAIETPNGLGFYDPSESPEMPRGITGERWDAFVADCGNWGKVTRRPQISGATDV